MRTSGWVVAVLLGLGGAAALARPGDAPADPAAERFQRLIARLGSEHFREREAAGRELDALGEAALDALRHAARTGDPETRRRAADLVERIQQRLLTARILTPTLVQLDYKDTLLTEAVADLARRTGLSLTLNDPARFKGRTITVATGKVSAWEALEQFCRKADLHEWDGFLSLNGVRTPTVPAAPPVPVGGFLPIQGLQGRVVIRGGRTAQATSAPGNHVVLLDGPGDALPTHHAGAVRVRVLPPGTPFPVAATGDDMLLPLQVSAELRLHCPGALDLRVERAIDDQGQALAATAARPAPAGEVQEWVVMANGALIPGPAAARGGPIGVRLRRGEKPAKALRELAGVVSAQVRFADTVAVVDGPAASVGKVIPGEHGITLTLSALERTPRDEIKLTVGLQLPTEIQVARPPAGVAALPGLLPGMPVPAQNGVVIQQIVVAQGGGAASGPAGGTDYQGLSLEDAQGRRLTVVRGTHEVKFLTPQTYACQITAVFRPTAAGAEPARLVLTAMLPATIEVPFTLKDVPLP
jgi:hypothetical protein